LRSGHLEPGRVYATSWVGLHRLLVSRVTRGVLNYWRVFSHGLGRAGDGGLRGQAHFVVQRLVQLLVRVRSALRVRVLVVRRVAAVRAVHGVFTSWRGQVGQTVVVDVQVILRRAIRLSTEMIIQVFVRRSVRRTGIEKYCRGERNLAAAAAAHLALRHPHQLVLLLLGRFFQSSVPAVIHIVHVDGGLKRVSLGSVSLQEEYNV